LSVPDAILGLAVLLASVIIHENAHGVVALWLGDTTAKAAGRLTLNPVKHLDPVGSVILPAMLFFTGGVMFGYAKPVPINPAKLRGKDRAGFAIVALAGPVSNLLLAFIAVTLLERQTTAFAGVGIGTKILLFFFEWNMLLAAFNLVPIPPLDGSRLLRVVLSEKGRHTLDRIEPFGFLILLVLLVWLGEPFFRIVRLIRSGLLRLLPL
jgi:Zn-dependent protease